MIGVVADDVTGANDIGTMFAKHGYRVVVYSDYAGLTRGELEGHGVQVCILNTESRYDPPAEAYVKVRAATARLKEFGCSLYIKKTCSVFRGNVGAELDAMADELGIAFSLLVAAFPNNGRQTLHGYHFVHGVLLADSAFAADPVHPTRESNLARVVEAQSGRRVEIIHLEDVRAGKSGLAARIAEVRRIAGYALCDALDNRDLEQIAEVAAGEAMLGGSSAIAEFLPPFLPERPAGRPAPEVKVPAGQGILVVAGSVTPQTRAQSEHLVALGWPVVTLNSLDLLVPAERAVTVTAAAERLQEALAGGKNALLRVTNSREEVQATKGRGRQLGLSEVETSRAISLALAETTERVVRALDLKGLVVAGGDTAAMVLGRLGITGNFVLEEIEPGVPSGRTLGARRMLVVLKSGSFGRPEFLEKAVRHLRALSGRSDG